MSPTESAEPSTARTFALPHRRSLKRSETLARDLAAYIVDSGLPAGSVLPREHEMIDELGVGRTTLREALRLLESRGILTIRSGPRGGPVVRQPEPSDLTDALTLILQFQRATMREVAEARTWLEPVVARAAAPMITSVEIERLRTVNKAMKDAIGVDEEQVSLANQQFHRIIAAAASNVVLRIFAETLLTVTERGIEDLHQSDTFKRQATRHHDALIAALVARDADAAEEQMRKHLRHGSEDRVKNNPALMERPLRWL